MITTKLAGELPRMLGIPDLMDLMGCSRNTAYKRTREAAFPTPVVFSDASYRWFTSEVMSWLDAQRVSHVERAARAEARRAAKSEKSAPANLPKPTPVVRRSTFKDAA
jgi:predicted DNA-binding transcriptional regulator AlpA